MDENIKFSNLPSPAKKAFWLVSEFAIRRSVIRQQFKISKATLKRWISKKGEIRLKKGRPPLLNPTLKMALQDQLRERAAQLSPMTKREIAATVCCNYVFFFIFIEFQ